MVSDLKRDRISVIPLDDDLLESFSYLISLSEEVQYSLISSSEEVQDCLLVL